MITSHESKTKKKQLSEKKRQNQSLNETQDNLPSFLSFDNTPTPVSPIPSHSPSPLTLSNLISTPPNISPLTLPKIMSTPIRTFNMNIQRENNSNNGDNNEIEMELEIQMETTTTTTSTSTTTIINENINNIESENNLNQVYLTPVIPLDHISITLPRNINQIIEEEFELEDQEEEKQQEERNERENENENITTEIDETNETNENQLLPPQSPKLNLSEPEVPVNTLPSNSSRSLDFSTSNSNLLNNLSLIKFAGVFVTFRLIGSFFGVPFLIPPILPTFFLSFPTFYSLSTRWCTNLKKI
mmetsp:Transcript_7408/g.7827  ORF Transcript_7408/g.7827 Transcript_7408/m.7827 type:complete len:301 (+) Transcript_7408:1468-2370(+)